MEVSLQSRVETLIIKQNGTNEKDLIFKTYGEEFDKLVKLVEAISQ